MTAIVHLQLPEVVRVAGERMGWLTLCGAAATLTCPFVRVASAVFANEPEKVTCPSCRRKMGERS